MGWRFRRTLSMGGFRWTVSKQGLGGSWGVGGILRFGLSPDGRRYVSVRIPGTGVSWMKYYGRATVPPGSSIGTVPLSPASVSTQAPNPKSATQQAPKSQPWWKQKGLGN